jgi:2-oxoacid:acceptor oxidoreductase gamma subunit (pyruvate/2-ketoisovalerate family)
MTVAEKTAYEIRWHGRGGQGAVTSAKILAEAAYHSGFAGVTSQPSFGAERRGAPITASSRLAHEPIRVLSQVTEPDIVVVLDDSLLGVANAAAGLAPGGMVIVNTNRTAAELGVAGDAHVVTSDVTGAAMAADLIVGGQPMVSTAILGAFAAATGLITMGSVEAAISHAFSGKAAAKNIEAARIAFECTKA